MARLQIQAEMYLLCIGAQESVPGSAVSSSPLVTRVLFDLGLFQGHFPGALIVTNAALSAVVSGASELARGEQRAWILATASSKASPVFFKQRTLIAKTPKESRWHLQIQNQINGGGKNP